MAGEPGGGVARELDLLLRSFSSSIFANKRSMLLVTKLLLGVGGFGRSGDDDDAPLLWTCKFGVEEGGELFGDFVKKAFMLAMSSVKGVADG